MLRPGDTIEWVFEVDGVLVHPGARITSSTMGCLVPMGRPIVILSLVDDVIAWIDRNGTLFHMRTTDGVEGLHVINAPELRMVPRTMSREHHNTTP